MGSVRVSRKKTSLKIYNVLVQENNFELTNKIFWLSTSRLKFKFFLIFSLLIRRIRYFKASYI